MINNLAYTGLTIRSKPCGSGSTGFLAVVSLGQVKRAITIVTALEVIPIFEVCEICATCVIPTPLYATSRRLWPRQDLPQPESLCFLCWGWHGCPLADRVTPKSYTYLEFSLAYNRYMPLQHHRWRKPLSVTEHWLHCMSWWPRSAPNLTSCLFRSNILKKGCGTSSTNHEWQGLHYVCIMCMHTYIISSFRNDMSSITAKHEFPTHATSLSWARTISLKPCYPVWKEVL